jgi:predicted DNA-binding transcriptional regulator YafY
VRITYVDSGYIETVRDVRIDSVIMDRHETRIAASDVATGERRHFRADRITRAEPVPAARP